MMQASVQQLEQDIAAHPGDALLWIQLARTHMTLKEPVKARQAIRRAELAATHQPEIQHALALYYAQNGNRKRAAELELAFARSPKADTFAPARAAFLCAESGLTKDAIAMGELAITRQDRGDLRALLAKLYLSSGQSEKATLHFRQWIRLEPYLEQAYVDFSASLLQQGRFVDALSILEEARTKFDKSPQIIVSLGVSYYGMRRFPEAAASFLSVTDFAPTVEQPYLFLARMIDQLDAFMPEILKRFSAWNDADKTSNQPPFVYAKALLAAGQSKQEAEVLLQESIRRNNKFWAAHFELGTLLDSRRNWAGARLALEAAITLSPNQAAPHYRLARVYDRLNLPIKAAEERKKHAAILAVTKLKGGMVPID